MIIGRDNLNGLKVNDKVQYFFGLAFVAPIPTKQDAFKPLHAWEVNEDGTETVLNNFYVKKPDASALKGFQAEIQEAARGEFSTNNLIRKPASIEVVLSISVTEKRFYAVDVDNLAKAVLDCLNGIAYEDDSQIVSLICSKHIHPLNVNGIMIGITELTDTNRGFRDEIFLYSYQPDEDVLRMIQPKIDRIMKQQLKKSSLGKP